MFYNISLLQNVAGISVNSLYYRLLGADVAVPDVSLPGLQNVT